MSKANRTLDDHLLDTLRAFGPAGSEVWPSVRTLATRSGLTEANVTASLKRLRAKGAISWRTLRPFSQLPNGQRTFRGCRVFTVLVVLLREGSPGSGRYA